MDEYGAKLQVNEVNPIGMESFTERIKRDKQRLQLQLDDLNRLSEIFEKNPDMKEAMELLMRSNIRY